MSIRIKDNNPMTSFQISSIIKSIRLFVMHADTPPPSEVVVYSDSVMPVEDEPGFYEAQLKIGIDYLGMKHHKVHIKFKVRNFNILPDTMVYV